MISLTILLAVTVAYGAGGPAASQPKDEGTSKNRTTEALKRLAKKTVEVVPAIMERVVGIILTFLTKLLDLELHMHGPSFSLLQDLLGYD